MAQVIIEVDDAELQRWSAESTVQQPNILDWILGRTRFTSLRPTVCASDVRGHILNISTKWSG
jgi:hypothetical protein